VKVAVVNIGRILTGDIELPLSRESSILLRDGKIAKVGDLSSDDVQTSDVVIDADGATLMPGLIDSHVHITFGDYTPRQKTVGFLESYVHGGVTSSISASEVHVPGRPKDVQGIKALAIAAQRCFQDYRPGGMRVYAGTLILEPGLERADFEELRSAGIRMVKAGFGNFASPYEYAPLIQLAREYGMLSLVHTGGASIPGSSGIWAEHLLAMEPDVSFHANGGPVAIPEEGFERLVAESSMAIQVCTAGNLRTTLLIARLLAQRSQLQRLLIATDTPTGSGIMPLGMLYTISHLCSLGGMDPAIAVAAATGNNARTFRLNSGFIRPGCDADVIIIDACLGGSQSDPLSAFTNGDVVAIGAVISDGVPRFVGRSRNTPATIRNVRIASSRILQTFS